MGRTIAAVGEIQPRISEIYGTIKLLKISNYFERISTVTRKQKLTRLDSSGDAKLSSSTLTFTVRTPVNKRGLY